MLQYIEVQNNGQMVAFRLYVFIDLYPKLTGILVSGCVRRGEGAGGGHKGAEADHHGYMCPGIKPAKYQIVTQQSLK